MTSLAEGRWPESGGGGGPSAALVYSVSVALWELGISGLEHEARMEVEMSKNGVYTRA